MYEFNNSYKLITDMVYSKNHSKGYLKGRGSESHLACMVHFKEAQWIGYYLLIKIKEFLVLWKFSNAFVNREIVTTRNKHLVKLKL